MGIIAEAFRTGGIWMYLILAASLLGWPLAVIGIVVGYLSKKSTAAIVLGGLVLAIGVGTAGIGGFAYMRGLAETEKAVEHASPEYRDRLRQKGEELSKYPLYFGLGGGSVPTLLGLLTIGVGLARRSDTIQ